jgi:hypothetical protein
MAEEPVCISDLTCPKCEEIHYYISYEMGVDPSDGKEKPCAHLECWGCGVSTKLFSTTKV